ncbi:hypothetical protein Sala_0278 [Sphingopyxis alaskensis RB2256]|uniref:Uncharacterized protein n=2 Tax=Sphingopyxis alaskensis TaxID=117207 RepID=Q1GWH1_SPHAL|nr:hypothetical protein Sala_0278 [Sphingopyxis alaskensis RB2256]
MSRTRFAVRRSIAMKRIDLPGGEQVGLSSRPAKSWNEVRGVSKGARDQLAPFALGLTAHRQKRDAAVQRMTEIPFRGSYKGSHVGVSPFDNPFLTRFRLFRSRIGAAFDI